MTGDNVRHEYDAPKLSHSEKLRVNALESQDALKYYQLCTESGTKPEDPALYEMGQLDFVRLQQGTVCHSQLEKRVKPVLTDPCSIETYVSFVEEVKRDGVPTDVYQWPDYKSRVLKKYFHSAFGNKRNLNSMSSAQIGTAFKHMLTYAKKIANSSKSQPATVKG